MRGIEDGLSYKLIASRYGIGLDTVRNHIRSAGPLLAPAWPTCA